MAMRARFLMRIRRFVTPLRGRTGRTTLLLLLLLVALVRVLLLLCLRNCVQDAFGSIFRRIFAVDPGSVPAVVVRNTKELEMVYETLTSGLKGIDELRDSTNDPIIVFWQVQGPEERNGTFLTKNGLVNG